MTSGLISCKIFGGKEVQSPKIPHEFIYTSVGDDDTIFIATIQYNSFHGPIKVKKKMGSYNEEMFDKIYRDALSSKDWTYGNYNMNRKDGEWFVLSEKNEKVLLINFRNDTLHGAYLRLFSDGSDTLEFRNYTDGILDGSYIANIGGGAVNGVPLYGKHRWELNYTMGKLDGVQRNYYDGRIKEEIIFEHGRIKEIRFSDYIVENKVIENGDGYIVVDNASFAFGILGIQFSTNPSERSHLAIFGDDILSGRIELCRGYFCPGELELYSEISKEKRSFEISYDIKMKRK